MDVIVEADMRLKNASSLRILRATIGLSPIRVFVISFCIFLLCLWLAPIEATMQFGVWSGVFLMLSVLAAGLGLYLGSMRSANLPGIAASGAAYAWDVAAVRCVWLGTVGVLLLLLDRFVVRGVQVGADMMEAREFMAATATGPIGIAAALLSSFAAFGLISVWVAETFLSPVRRFIKALAVVNLVIFVGLPLSFGSRSTLLACFILHALAISFRNQFIGQIVSTKSKLLAGLAGVSLLGALTVIMAQRLELMGIAPVDSIRFSGYAYTIRPTDGLVGLLESSDLLATLGASLYSLVAYGIHGLYEFRVLFEDFGGEFTDGKMLFWLPLKLISIILSMNMNFDFDQLNGYRAGVFSTFAGPFFVDFGLLAPILISIVFFAMTIPYRLVLAGDLRWLFAVLQVNVVVALAPMLSLIHAAAGLYILVAAVGLFFLIPRRATVILKI